MEKNETNKQSIDEAFRKYAREVGISTHKAAFKAGYIEASKSVETQQGWVDVKEQLPEVGQHVWLCYDHEDGQHIDLEIWTQEAHKYHTINGVAFWMPCNRPEPLKPTTNK